MRNNKIKGLIIGFMVTGFVFALVGAASAQHATRVRFARGATSATVSGTLTGYKDARVFIIRVRAGQTIRTEPLGRPSHYISIFIKDPAGEDAGDMDMSCHGRREITPTVAGDYRLQIVECQKADPWRGTFKFRVTVR